MDKAGRRKIEEYFGKDPHLLTGGEANLAIKAIFGEIDWNNLSEILEQA